MKTRSLSSLTFDDLREIARGSRTGQAKIAGNTWVAEHRYGPFYEGPKHGEGDVLVILYQTAILTIHPDDSFTVSSGGWRTVTSKQRLNALLPAGYRVNQRNFEWFIDTPEGEYDFCDGDTWRLPEALADTA